MFGYIVANSAQLSEEEKTRYRAWYCGLCRALGERHGQPERLTLSYELTFLVILLSSVYREQTTSGEERCIIHPVRRHRYLHSEFSDYAADMNVLLTYYNLLDDWQDDRSLRGLLGSRALKRAANRAAAAYPRQSEAILGGLAALSKAEQKGELNPDLPAACFGNIMAELFAVREDENAERLRAFGRSLGRFIYIMDACIDFGDDLRHARYNPLAAMSKADFEPMLEMLAAECIRSFELLDVGEDKELMLNILYSGMWTKYCMKNKPRKQKEAAEDERPV